jgi:uncharacterized pyridoxal phosphate-containing UPF0001 family protein
VETIDSIKLADGMNKNWDASTKGYKLNIMIQINTSNEERMLECFFSSKS